MSSDGPFERAIQLQALEVARDLPPVLLDTREEQACFLVAEKVSNRTGIRSRESRIHRAYRCSCVGGNNLRLRSRRGQGRRDSLRRRAVMSRNKEQEACSSDCDEKECKEDSQGYIPFSRKGSRMSPL